MVVRKQQSKINLWIMIGISILLISGIELSDSIRWILLTLIICIGLDQVLRYFKKDKTDERDKSTSRTKLAMAISFMVLSLSIGVYSAFKYF